MSALAIPVMCTGCRQRVPATNLDVARLVARCDRCDRVFSFEAQKGAISEELSCPSTMTVHPDGISAASTAATYRTVATRGPLTLTYRPPRGGHVLRFFFALAWCAGLVFAYSFAFAEEVPGAPLLFLLVYAAVGAWLLYGSLVGLLNVTTISVDDRMLRVRHDPLPSGRACGVELAKLRQLFVRRHEVRTKRGRHVSYLVAADVDGSDEVLLAGLGSEHEARFVERTIERHLAIVDEPSR